MDATFILPDFPGVSMAIDVGLDLCSRANGFQQCRRVLQSHITADSRDVMNQDQSRFLRVLIKGFRQPAQLFLTEKTGSRKRFYEGIENEPNGTRRAQQRD